MSPAPATIPRPDLVAALVGRARAGAPLLLTGPPGAGKTTLLLQAAAELRGGGAVPVYLDFFGAVSSAERFVRAALAALPAGGFGPRLAEAVEIRRRADAGRLQGEPAVRALLELLAAADRAGERPLVLLLDEPTEIRSLAYFPGLRQAHALLAAALRRRPRGTLLASSFPTQAREMFGFEALALPPLSAAELAAAGLPTRAAEPLLRLTGGLPRYLRVLLEAGVEDPLAAWSRAMAPGGALDQACHWTYEALLLRSRGYGMSKAVLAAVAQEEGLNLTALVARLGRTPGATRDYLQWLLDVDALRMVRKRYFYVDPLLRQWVRLHQRGTPAGPADLQRVGQELLQAQPAEPEPARRPRGARAAAAVEKATEPAAEEPVAAPPRRRPSLDIEID